jgi:hypothetical protein
MQGHDNTFSHCFQACKVHDSIESANQSDQTLSVFTSSLLLITIQQSVWQTFLGQFCLLWRQYNLNKSFSCNFTSFDILPWIPKLHFQKQ